MKSKSKIVKTSATDKPLILVTNDDGVMAPGIRALAKAMCAIGQVVIVAPDKGQSGMGHAITINQPLRLTKVEYEDGIEAYQCSGTPVDCVKLAVDIVLHRKPDLCVSGINHGSNASINVIYSGTMSAAVEAALEGIPSIGFSLCDYRYDANFEHGISYCVSLAQMMLDNPVPEGTLLNVNIPSLPKDKIKGIKICRQANAKWVEEFDKRKDPRGVQYYWLTGRFVNKDKGQDTDEWALKEGYVSVTPVQYDLTAHHAISFINQNWKIS
jgi:5'-nucleotidase